MAKADESHSITNAPIPLSMDQGGRAKRYFISMMIRTACFILSIILPSPYRWFAAVGALFLPYISVVIANAGRETVQFNSNKLNDIKEIH